MNSDNCCIWDTVNTYFPRDSTPLTEGYSLVCIHRYIHSWIFFYRKGYPQWPCSILRYDQQVQKDASNLCCIQFATAVIFSFSYLYDELSPLIVLFVKMFLRQSFTNDREISHMFLKTWPSWSPYLNSVDFWLRRLLKNLVHQGRLLTWHTWKKALLCMWEASQEGSVVEQVLNWLQILNRWYLPLS